MSQRAKMVIVDQDADTTTGIVRCVCGEQFPFDIHTEENMVFFPDENILEICCPGCGCLRAKEARPIDDSREEELRRTIGSKTRDIIAATQRLRRR